jgi:hypothetical protein
VALGFSVRAKPVRAAPFLAGKNPVKRDSVSGKLGRHLRMERMPAETPASVFSGEGPERFSLVARFGVWGLVSRTFDVPDDTVDGASIGAKTTTHAKVEQRAVYPCRRERRFSGWGRRVLSTVYLFGRRYRFRELERIGARVSYGRMVRWVPTGSYLCSW